MNGELVRYAAKQIVGWLFMALMIGMTVVLFVGLYMCDHYRWGNCP